MFVGGYHIKKFNVHSMISCFVNGGRCWKIGFWN